MSNRDYPFSGLAIRVWPYSGLACSGSLPFRSVCSGLFVPVCQHASSSPLRCAHVPVLSPHSASPLNSLSSTAPLRTIPPYSAQSSPARHHSVAFKATLPSARFDPVTSLSSPIILPGPHIASPQPALQSSTRSGNTPTAGFYPIQRPFL